MNAQKQQVEEFFNEIATDYKSKYSATNAFSHYFFNERLAEATKGFYFKNKKILDIGAGTGDLYDYLLAMEPTIDYCASDVAANMLEQSAIPAERRFVGFCHQTDFPFKQFDYIFMLGVTTYLNAEESKKTFDFIHSSLAENGKAILTFTNESSFDWKIRKIFKAIGKNVTPKKYVLSGDFQIYPKTTGETEKLLEPQFEIEEVRWLNHTVFPFNQLLKGFSVKIAETLHRKLKSKQFLNLLSSDFLFVLTKRK